MPTEWHQLIAGYLYRVLFAFVLAGDLGKVLYSPFRIRTVPGKFREPDVLFMLKANDHRRHNEYWEGADLVMEVVSDDDRRRDLETKRFEYAEAGVPEYWIVDPRTRQITVLVLAGDRYEEHGVFNPGDRATSQLLSDFGVDVDAVFAV